MRDWRSVLKVLPAAVVLLIAAFFIFGLGLFAGLLVSGAGWLALLLVVAFVAVGGAINAGFEAVLLAPFKGIRRLVKGPKQPEPEREPDPQLQRYGQIFTIGAALVFVLGMIYGLLSTHLGGAP